LIRKRYPIYDDPIIISLIYTELVPLSKTYRPTYEQLKNDVPKRLNHGLTYIIISEKTHHFCGFVHVIINKKVMLINLLVVTKEARLQQYGRKLMTHCEKEAIRQNCTRIELFVDHLNQGALSFYTKLGYRMIGLEPSSYCYILSRSL
jgi:ribosomal protein S18 acetylase RimI-like enzyme